MYLAIYYPHLWLAEAVFAVFAVVRKPHPSSQLVNNSSCTRETGTVRHSHNSSRVSANMADSEDEDSSLNLTGFLFGNINEKGELEDTEILDEVMSVSLQTPEWIIAQKRCAVISIFSIVERMPRKTIRKQQSVQSSQYPY